MIYTIVNGINWDIIHAPASVAAFSPSLGLICVLDKQVVDIDGYYVAYKPITLPCILFMFIEMKFIHCHSCVMFAMKSMSMCND